MRANSFHTGRSIRAGMSGWPDNDPKQEGPGFSWPAQVLALTMIVLAVVVGDAPEPAQTTEPGRASAADTIRGSSAGASLAHYRRRALWAESRLRCLSSLRSYRTGRALALCGVED